MNVRINVHPLPSNITRERERTYDALTITSPEVELVIFLDEAVHEALLVALADGLPRYSVRTIAVGEPESDIEQTYPIPRNDRVLASFHDPMTRPIDAPE
jgi:hypothetical protein